LLLLDASWNMQTCSFGSPSIDDCHKRCNRWMQDTLLSYQQGMPSLLKLPERQLPALLQPELRHYRLETHACALSFCCRPFLIQPLGILLISVILSLVIKPTSSPCCVQIIGLATALMLHFYWKHQARPKPLHESHLSRLCPMDALRPMCLKQARHRGSRPFSVGWRNRAPGSSRRCSS